MLQAMNITKQFGKEGPPALDNVRLDIDPGEFLAVVGRSGSGKSTLLNVLSTLLAPDRGQLLYHGENLAQASESRINHLRHKDFSVIFQFHHLMPYLTAEENVLLPVMKQYRPVAQAMRIRARACLERVGLEDKGGRLPGELSGGEQQRVAIARALAKDCQVLFADEPTGSLDRATGESVMDLLAELNRDGLTLVVVTHDSDYASRAGRVVTMADSRIVDQGGSSGPSAPPGHCA